MIFKDHIGYSIESRLEVGVRWVKISPARGGGGAYKPWWIDFGDFSR